MPLGGELSAGEIDILRRWIDDGAKWPGDPRRWPAIWPARWPGPATETGRDQWPEVSRRKITAEHRRYWAFQTPTAPPVPSVQGGADAQMVSNPIDAFILAGLAKQE
jgi:hypothetical protein